MARSAFPRAVGSSAFRENIIEYNITPIFRGLQISGGQLPASHCFLPVGVRNVPMVLTRGVRGLRAHHVLCFASQPQPRSTCDHCVRKGEFLRSAFSVSILSAAGACSPSGCSPLPFPFCSLLGLVLPVGPHQEGPGGDLHELQGGTGPPGLVPPHAPLHPESPGERGEGQ